MSVAIPVAECRRSVAATAFWPGAVETAVSVASRLHADAARAPVPFERFMEAALYDEDGYYMRPGRKTGAGPEADFATAPVLHPFMGEAVAKEAADVYERLGPPEVFQVVEFGGGEGDLARAALAWMDREAPALAEAVQWLHVEASPVHREAQAEAADKRIQWAAAMPETTGLVVAHEFLDALPFAWLERRKGDWAEVHVRSDGTRFSETYGIPSKAAHDAAPLGDFQEGQRVASMPRAKAWCRDVADRLVAGRVVVVDYGGAGPALHVRDRSGSVRGFRGQQLVEDVLGAEPGTIDITANVDFALVAMWLGGAGLAVQERESQEAFLLRHGILDALNAQERDTVEGASAYLRLRQLMLPSAMGEAFQVLRADKAVP